MSKFYLILFLLILMGCDSHEYEGFDGENTKGVTFIPIVKSDNTKEEETVMNLLKNGGLEEWESFWTPEMPKYWSLPSNNYVKRNKLNHCEGEYSAKMESEESGKTARLEQRIEVIPGQYINIRFCYGMTKWKSKGARTYCYFRTYAAEKYNLSAEELRSFYGDEKYHIIRGGGYGLTYLPHELNKWLLFNETIEVPPTAHYFVFGINSYYGTTMYVDNCSIKDVTNEVATGIKQPTI